VNNPELSLSASLCVLVVLVGQLVQIVIVRSFVKLEFTRLDISRCADIVTGLCCLVLL